MFKRAGGDHALFLLIGRVLDDISQELPFIIEYVFFFQAEDGIRDPLVTGVQTCALPISPVPQASVSASTPRSYVRMRHAGPPLLSWPSRDRKFTFAPAGPTHGFDRSARPRDRKSVV